MVRSNIGGGQLINVPVVPVFLPGLGYWDDTVKWDDATKWLD